MVLAMATDEAWRHGIPFKTKRKSELVEIYSNLVFGYLQLPPGRRNPKNAGAIHSDRTEFPEHFKIAYGITKQSLAKYEKDVNSSRKPKFILGSPVNPADGSILMTRKEELKTEKPIKRERKRIARML